MLPSSASPADWDEVDVHNAIVTMILLSNFLPGTRRFHRFVRFLIGVLLGLQFGRFLTGSRWTKLAVLDAYKSSDYSTKPYVDLVEEGMKEKGDQLQAFARVGVASFASTFGDGSGAGAGEGKKNKDSFLSKVQARVESVGNWMKKRPKTKPERVILIHCAVFGGSLLVFGGHLFSQFMMIGSFGAGMLHDNVWNMLRKQSAVRSWLDRWATRAIE